MQALVIPASCLVVGVILGLAAGPIWRALGMSGQILMRNALNQFPGVRSVIERFCPDCVSMRRFDPAVLKTTSEKVTWAEERFSFGHWARDVVVGFSNGDTAVIALTEAVTCSRSVSGSLSDYLLGLTDDELKRVSWFGVVNSGTDRKTSVTLMKAPTMKIRKALDLRRSNKMVPVAA